MRVFCELRIEGSPKDLDELLTKISTEGGQGWSRNETREKQIPSSDASLLCFDCDERDGRPSASLWLARRASSARVSNIVPNRKNRLTYDEYNSILDEFHRLFIKDTAEKFHLTIELTKPDQTLEDWVDKDVAKKLRFFSETANKSTGSAHPLDRERWFAFVIAAHRHASALDSSRLQRWLAEEGGWDSETASDLAIEYATGRSLLEYYDKAK